MIQIKIIPEISAKVFEHKIEPGTQGMFSFSYSADNIWFGAYFGRNMVGVSCLKYHKGYAHITHTYVLPQFRGRGILTRFTKLQLNHVSSSKVDCIHASVTPMSLRVHLKLGATVLQTYKNQNTRIAYENLSRN